MTAEKLLSLYNQMPTSEQDKFCFLQNDKDKGNWYFIIFSALAVFGGLSLFSLICYGAYLLVKMI